MAPLQLLAVRMFPRAPKELALPPFHGADASVRRDVHDAACAGLPTQLEQPFLSKAILLLLQAPLQVRTRMILQLLIRAPRRLAATQQNNLLPLAELRQQISRALRQRTPAPERPGESAPRRLSGATRRGESVPPPL